MRNAHNKWNEISIYSTQYLLVMHDKDAPSEREAFQLILWHNKELKTC